jgi:hypothetical protein
MAIPARQIGQPSSTKAQLLWNISKQLETLIKVAGNVYIPQCPANTWTFTAGDTSIFPTSTTGYTLYEGSWTQYDDGQATDPVSFAGDLLIDGSTENSFYLSTNGYFYTSNVEFDINGNQQDLYLTPGDPLDDGDTQNFWYQNTGDASKWKTSILVYCGHCCGSPNQQTPYSYILNIYKDSEYQYIETVCKTNAGGSSGPQTNPEDSDVLTQVWQSDPNGTTWTYLGFGNVQ